MCDSFREIKNAISLQVFEEIDVETKKLIDKKVVIDYSSPNIANASMSAICAR
jgi:arginyl-tRNA synthetase